MQYTLVRYGRTINLGNYESAKLELEAAIGDGETLDSVLAGCRDFVGQFELRVKGGDDTLPAASTVANAEVKRTAKGAAARAATTSGKAESQAGLARRKPTGRKSGETEQSAQPVAPGKLLWKKSDWVGVVAGLDANGVLNNFKNEMTDAELYANVEAWKTCCEAYADQARKVIGPDDAARPEMVALLKAERDRINNPTPAKKPRAPRKPKATQAV